MQAEGEIRDAQESRGLADGNKRQVQGIGAASSTETVEEEFDLAAELDQAIARRDQQGAAVLGGGDAAPDGPRRDDSASREFYSQSCLVHTSDPADEEVRVAQRVRLISINITSPP